MPLPNGPAPLTTRIERYLHSIGLTKFAQRLADISNLFKWFRASDDYSDAWRQRHYTSMMRSDPYLALRLAADDEQRFHAFGGMIGSHGTRLLFRFHAGPTTLSSPVHREHQRTVRKIRALCHRVLSPAINKLGAYDDRDRRYNRVVKVLCARVVSPQELLTIQSALPAGVSVTRHVFPVADFPAELRAWAAADLPLDEIARADFELFIHGLQLTSYCKIPAEVKAKFAIDSKPATANCAPSDDREANLLAAIARPTGKMYVPRSPKTGRLARFMSVIVDRATKLDEIDLTEWLILPSSA